MRRSAIRRIVMVVASVVLCTGMATGWISSCFGNTHGQLAKLALQDRLLPAAEYPDLQRFRDKLIEGSSNESGHPQTISNIAREDKLDDEWNQVMKAYGDKNFAEAYKHLGIMGHLVQDMAVPAHAYNINHINYRPEWTWPRPRNEVWGDNFEFYATNHSIVPKIDALVVTDRQGGGDPRAFYRSMRDDTKSAVQVTENPENPGADRFQIPAWPGSEGIPDQTDEEARWTHYWRVKTPDELGPDGKGMERTFISDLLPQFTGTDSFTGKFGTNMFPREHEWSEAARERFENGAQDDINRVVPTRYPPGWRKDFYDRFLLERAKQAVRYTAGCWAAASKLLPPLVRPLGDPPAVGGLIVIAFTVLENRKQTMSSIVVYVDGARVVTLDDPVLDFNSDPAQLPWKKDFNVVLPITPGSTPHPGQIVATDGDGNVGSMDITVYEYP